MIEVTIVLAGPLRRYYRTSETAKHERVQLSSGATIRDLMDHYGIPREKVSHIVVNRLRGEMDTVLEDGDEIRLIPLAAGG